MKKAHYTIAEAVQLIADETDTRSEDILEALTGVALDEEDSLDVRSLLKEN